MSPLGDRVLLRALEPKKETDGGVILATDEAERPTLGKVREDGGRARVTKEREREREKKKKGMTKFALRVGFSFPSHRSNGSSGLKTPRGRRGLKTPFLRGSVTIYRDIYKFERLASDLFLFFFVFSLFCPPPFFYNPKTLTATFSLCINTKPTTPRSSPSAPARPTTTARPRPSASRRARRCSTRGTPGATSPARTGASTLSSRPPTSWPRSPEEEEEEEEEEEKGKRGFGAFSEALPAAFEVSGWGRRGRGWMALKLFCEGVPLC